MLSLETDTLTGEVRASTAQIRATQVASPTDGRQLDRPAGLPKGALELVDVANAVPVLGRGAHVDGEAGQVLEEEGHRRGKEERAALGKDPSLFARHRHGRIPVI